jgi:hypothetical protein
MHDILQINLMGNRAEDSSATALHTLQSYQDLVALMNSYPIFTGVIFLIYFLIFTYLLIGIHNNHG